MKDVPFEFSEEEYSGMYFVCGFWNETLLLLLGDIGGDSPIDL